MTRRRNKAARIRALYAEGLSPREIADKVGCDPAYVRVVARQRIGGRSPSDINYILSKYGSVAAYHGEHYRAHRAYHLARLKRLRLTPAFRKKEKRWNRANYLRRKARMLAESTAPP